MRFAGETVAETRGAMLLRQHGFLPVFWIPGADVRRDLLEPSDWTTESPYRGRASYWHLRVGDRVAESAVWTYAEPRSGSPDTRGFFALDFHSMDAWYEEEERICAPMRVAVRGTSSSRWAVSGSPRRAGPCCSTRPA